MTGTVFGRLAFAAASAAFLAAAVAAQQTTAPPPTAAPASSAEPSAKNLKVLPMGIPRQNLIGVMQMMSSSLGVKCTFCHVGQSRETMDFASDAMKEKLVARAMLDMVRRINEQDFKVTEWSKSKVTCYTCHRGAAHPLTAAPKPGETPPPVEHRHEG
ncbi:c-type cytochrome [Sphingomonas sp. HDW15A]|uniref:c-type cytochrome n=1 Tax=Sphingomonas sp. HDW15A TaxID=2714942 RepID=UPI001407A75E|nr:c-type cytochrome [Sphingomonas sp. HDW15A]QIK96356.1 c-type cytochrome [Sphingomonas sp. HDW15A]